MTFKGLFFLVGFLVDRSQHCSVLQRKTLQGHCLQCDFRYFGPWRTCWKSTCSTDDFRGNGFMIKNNTGNINIPVTKLRLAAEKKWKGSSSSCTVFSGCFQRRCFKRQFLPQTAGMVENGETSHPFTLKHTSKSVSWDVAEMFQDFRTQFREIESKSSRNALDKILSQEISSTSNPFPL